MTTQHQSQPHIPLSAVVGLLLVLWGVVSPAVAYGRGFWRSVLHYVDNADYAGCDTSYVRLPKEGFALYANTLLTGTHLYITHASAAPEHVPFVANGSLATQQATQLSLGLTYRGWGLSYSRDVSDFDDTEWSFMTYGKSYGAEFRLHNSHSLSGTLQFETPEGDPIDDAFVDIVPSACHQRTLIANTFYVFSHERFSLPAALSHTVIQRRSSGSWLAALNFRYTRTHQSPDKLIQSQLHVGGGYAYNWVWGDGRFLLHTSMMPTLSVWSRCRTTSEREQSSYNLYQKWFSPGGTANLSCVCNLGSWLTGFTSLLNFDSMRTTEGFSLFTSDWRIRGFVGYRF